MVEVLIESGGGLRRVMIGGFIGRKLLACGSCQVRRECYCERGTYRKKETNVRPNVSRKIQNLCYHARVKIVVASDKIEPMNAETCRNLPIADLNVSKQCLDGLRRSGFSTVGELTEFLEQTWGGRAGTVGVTPDFLRYLDETVNKLKEIGCWPESLQEE